MYIQKYYEGLSLVYLLASLRNWEVSGVLSKLQCFLGPTNSGGG